MRYPSQGHPSSLARSRSEGLHKSRVLEGDGTTLACSPPLLHTTEYLFVISTWRDGAPLLCSDKLPHFSEFLRLLILLL